MSSEAPHAPTPPAGVNHQGNAFDFLRLLAAWLVLVSHSYPLSGNGAKEPMASTIGIDTLGGVGVSVFFVVSGYLVTQSLQRSDGVIDFVRKRALRIYPALLIVCVLSVLLCGFFWTTLPTNEYFRNGLTWSYLRTATAFSIQYHLPGVFADNPHAHAVNGSLWSIAYEVRFYVSLILINLLPFRFKYKAAGFLVFFITVFFAREQVSGLQQHEIYWGMDYQEVKLGILFYSGAVFASWNKLLKPSILIAAFALILINFAPHAGIRMLLYLLGSAHLFLWVGLNCGGYLRLPKSMGDWSYGVYLYAFPVQQVLAHYGLYKNGIFEYIMLTTIITAALAGLSWKFIELPALRLK